MFSARFSIQTPSKLPVEWFSKLERMPVGFSFHLVGWGVSYDTSVCKNCHRLRATKSPLLIFWGQLETPGLIEKLYRNPGDLLTGPSRNIKLLKHLTSARLIATKSPLLNYCFLRDLLTWISILGCHNQNRSPKFHRNPLDIRIFLRK